MTSASHVGHGITSVGCGFDDIGSFCKHIALYRCADVAKMEKEEERSKNGEYGKI